jgi:hypothetical protein
LYLYGERQAMGERIAGFDLKARLGRYSGGVIQVGERGSEPKELPIPCFRCGVCCTRYQVRLSLVETKQIADELGFDWDD